MDGRRAEMASGTALFAVAPGTITPGIAERHTGTRTSQAIVTTTLASVLPELMTGRSDPDLTRLVFRASHAAERLRRNRKVAGVLVGGRGRANARRRLRFSLGNSAHGG